MITRPSWTRLSQGVIFSEAIAEDYRTAEVFGITITARCDFAQTKAIKYNYLPIVNFDRWIRHEGKFQLIYRAERDLKNTISAILKKHDLDPSILGFQTLEAVLEKHFSDTKGKKASDKEKLRNLGHKLSFLAQCENSTGEDKFRKLLTNHDPIAKKITKELVSNQLSGYYFLPAVSPAEPSQQNLPEQGFVALLREIRNIPAVIADCLTQGLTRAEYRELLEKNGAPEGGLKIGDEEIAIVVGQLKSPQLEHLMQCFTILFGRIGLPDPPKGIESGLLRATCADSRSE